MIWLQLHALYTENAKDTVVIDDSLLQRIGRDDNDAFAELYQKTERVVYAFIFSILRHPNDTQDLVQDTYLKIKAAAHLYEPRGKPMAWIFTIARNLCYEKFRRERFQSNTEPALEDSLDYADITDETDRLVLQTAMAILSEEERSIVLLHAVSGYRHREIAALLDKPLSTVLSKYRRSLAKLHAHMVGKESSHAQK